MYHIRLNAKSADRYLPYQTFDSLQLLHDLVVRPENWVDHVRRYTASISTTLLYGWRTPGTGAGYVKDLLEWMEVTSEALNFNLVDFYPFLKVVYDFLPRWLLPSKNKLYELQKLENRVFYELLNRAKDNLETGQAYPSFIRDMLEDKDHDRLTERQIANNAAHGFGAAMDTSANTIMGFIKAMVLFPHVQEKAQEELERVIGNERLPTWDDRSSLHYIRGVVEETLRWAPSPISGAVPHSAREEDVYNGMKITKGSIVMMNIWSLNHNRYSNPRDFDPLRQDPSLTLTENNAISQDSARRLHFTFGAGRRVCPGFHVAQRNLFLAISRMLWAFNIERQRDVNGKETPIDRDAITPESGLIIRPADFKCIITPRDDVRKKLIVEQWRQAEKSLDSEGNFKADFIKASFGES
ncbi:hypothetical protein KVR01_011675 [Diaporthe batatas]|uniref:uncharacterized protein n=1 Tax=Diaporthe batatas TaxID=748121 RepID=UPI001D0485E0|nr:uncharacterized protein KVR01_011675 [Diaporthe batatas]KAG8158553.1 hypothetical protein KVR01_011675 [Diaporthe batatas]